jgi:hypothetical protein
VELRTSPAFQLLVCYNITTPRSSVLRVTKNILRLRTPYPQQRTPGQVRLKGIGLPVQVALVVQVL